MPRVLVAEDSVTTRRLLVEILRSEPGVEVVGEASNGVEAVEMTRRLKPDVVTMDVHMPLMEGFEATRRIMVEAPTPIVIVTSSLDARAVEVSMHALRAGALTVLAPPAGPGADDFEVQRRRFLDAIESMSQVKVVRRWPERGVTVRPAPAPVGPRPRLVAMAASTGGPAAIAQVLSELPGGFPLPILVVQHIALGFGRGFATWLNTVSSIRVKVAEEGEPLAAQTVYVAPDDRHLGVTDRPAIALSSAPPIVGSRPSATFLFDSVARAFGDSAIAVILTGMGRDGVEGLRAIRAAGGRILAQDEESSVVFGMPGAAVAEGLADATLPLGKVASRLRELVEP